MRTCRSGLCPRSGGSVYASVHDVHPVRRQSLPLHAMRRPEFARRHADRWSGLCPRSGGSVYASVHDRHLRSQAEPAPTRDAKARVCKVAMRTCRSGLCPRLGGSVCASVHDLRPGRRQSLLLHAMRRPEFARQACGPVGAGSARDPGVRFTPRCMISTRSQAEPAPTRNAEKVRVGAPAVVGSPAGQLPCLPKLASRVLT